MAVTGNTQMADARPDSVGRLRVGVICGLVAAQLLALVLVFQFGMRLECHQVASGNTCLFLRNSVARAIAVATVLILILPIRGAAFIPLISGTDRRLFHLLWTPLQITGFFLMLLPAILIDDFAASFDSVMWFWLIGAATCVTATLAWLAPASAWRATLGGLGVAPIVCLLAALALPELLSFSDGMWQLPALSDFTFARVVDVISLFPGEVTIDAPAKIVGLDNFLVLIADECSGTQGMVLVTVILTAYLYLYRQDLRFPQALLLIVIGLIGSAIFNILRISVLLWIGANHSRELALNGFHSHAGWLILTLLVIGLIWISRGIPWFFRTEAGPVATSRPVPLRSDPAAALLLPFAVFMLAELFVQTFYASPALGYPLKIAAIAATVLYLQVKPEDDAQGPGPFAVTSGLLVGIFWLITAPAADSAANLALRSQLNTLGPAALAIWAAIRVIGTVVVIPIVEERFFRGYLLDRLSGPELPRLILAIIASSVLFGLMHQRWLAGFLAGVVFAVIYLRRRRLNDAVWSHIAANAMIAAMAVATGNWALI
ncbi:MAG: exosortase E/protease, VPEID-CTERM system [Paracoccus denitrificans]|uniref:Exosortase E/protease, VPEID-CTERM system n=1 Tax=Paracoccus denitrificans TaxID=266 RepID=A0A533ICG1_PARDE|nr:MAG: exosortase E/protease, VPEID-CTERM system [Paracoccus denitrificans]